MDGCVSLASQDRENIVTYVSGTEEYNVKLKIESGYLDTSMLHCFCSCPYFAEDDFCEHIWATIIYVDKNILTQDFVNTVNDLGKKYGVELVDWEDVFDAEVQQKQYIQSLGWRKQLFVALKEPPPKNTPIKASQSQRIWYALNFENITHTDKIEIDLISQKLRKNGTWGVLRHFNPPFYSYDGSQGYPDDAEELELLETNNSEDHYNDRYGSYGRGSSDSRISIDLNSRAIVPILKKLCQTGRLTSYKPQIFNQLPSKNDYFEDRTINWGGDKSLNFVIALELDDSKKSAHKTDGPHYLLKGFFKSDDETIGFDEIESPITTSFIIHNKAVKLVNIDDCFPWVQAIRGSGNKILIPAKEVPEFISHLYQSSHAPFAIIPEELDWPTLELDFKPKVILIQDASLPPQNLYCKIKWQYGDSDFPISELGKGDIVDLSEKNRIARCFDKEEKSLALIDSLGFRRSTHTGIDFEIAKDQLLHVTEILTSEGWAVYLGRKKVVPHVAFDGIVSSGIDWFELTGKFSAEDASAELPEILTAIKQENDFLTLSDGNVFVIPDHLRRKLGAIARFGKTKDGSLRFNRSQTIILDTLLEEQGNIQVDADFKKISKNISKLSGISAKKEDPKFKGKLRDYQRDGLGWLYFLNQFKFGGCLADEMGLGKTVQILALFSLLKHKSKTKKTKPSLIVVPRSLVYNWQQEIAKYTALTCLDYSNPDRTKTRKNFGDHDLIITTYAILRRDITFLKDIDFSYAVLDEAQAIKNGASQSAKASRLLHADHRLCLTGTPVENQIDDLWSLFEFLNPGFLEGSSIKAYLKSASQNTHHQSLEMIAKAIQPFMLRRTKDKVAKDLPAKTEQTLFCELPPSQRKEYDRLKDFYRLSLSKKAKDVGFQKTKIHVLEALLRLRQAACHPGMIDAKLANTDSAKISLLLEHLDEIIRNGHKVLIFSQFTKMLALVQTALDKNQYTYEYLDGKTKNRQQKVDRFQSDPSCQVFLISLKAGGVGLNLTKAEYCFILDPWWNPAAESQAIDRAHRIGQENHVFAYKIIAKDTVEEKILALQNQKRELFDSIVTANGSFMKNLSSQDLELLLS